MGRSQQVVLHRLVPVGRVGGRPPSEEDRQADHRPAEGRQVDAAPAGLSRIGVDEAAYGGEKRARPAGVRRQCQLNGKVEPGGRDVGVDERPGGDPQGERQVVGVLADRFGAAALFQVRRRASQASKGGASEPPPCGSGRGWSGPCRVESVMASSGDAGLDADLYTAVHQR